MSETSALLDRPRRAAPPRTHARRRWPRGPAPRDEVSSTGTGFYVVARILVTAHHVVDGCPRVSLADGTELSLVASDPALDIAALMAPDRRAQLAVARRRRVRLGQRVHAAGFPYYSIAGTSLNLTSGNVSALAGVDDDRPLLQLLRPGPARQQRRPADRRPRCGARPRRGAPFGGLYRRGDRQPAAERQLRAARGRARLLPAPKRHCRRCQAASAASTWTTARPTASIRRSCRSSAADPRAGASTKRGTRHRLPAILSAKGIGAEARGCRAIGTAGSGAAGCGPETDVSVEFRRSGRSTRRDSRLPRMIKIANRHERAIRNVLPAPT